MRSNPEAPAGRQPLTVLLVEDNPTDVFVIKEVLRTCGHDLSVRVATNGQDALLYLEDAGRNSASPCPTLVLLDLNIPKVPGIDVLRQLRQTSRFKATPVIVVTSSAAEADRIAARSLGADAYFQKPGDLAAYMDLAQVIERVLRPCEEPHEPGE